MPAIVAHHAFRNARGARGVEDVERIGCEHRHAVGGFFGGDRFIAQACPVMVATGDEIAAMLRPLQDDAGPRLDAREPDGLVEQWLVLHDAAGLEPAACRKDQLWLGVLDPRRELFCGKAAEHYGM